MKVYFNSAITTDEKTKLRYKNIINYLEAEGHKVIGYELHESFEKLLQNRNSEEILESFKEFEKYIKLCDVFITDLSLPSSGIGYQVSQALILKKPVLALKYHSSEFEPMLSLAGAQSSLLTYKTYSENSIECTLRNFLKLAKDKVSTKFIMIIPAEIDRYLEWNSREMHKPKAEVTRDAIEKLMKRDKNYRRYLDNFEFPE